MISASQDRPADDLKQSPIGIDPSLADPVPGGGVLTQGDYETLAAFRFELRRFLQFSEEVARSLGLTPQQHQALLAIRAAPGREMSIGVLAEQLFIQPHSASELADRLEALNFLVRAPAADDRRRVRLRLTPTAEDRLSRMTTAHRGEVVRMRSTLNAILARLD